MSDSNEIDLPTFAVPKPNECIVRVTCRYGEFLQVEEGTGEKYLAELSNKLATKCKTIRKNEFFLAAKLPPITSTKAKAIIMGRIPKEHIWPYQAMDIWTFQDLNESSSEENSPLVDWFPMNVYNNNRKNLLLTEYFKCIKPSIITDIQDELEEEDDDYEDEEKEQNNVVEHNVVEHNVVQHNFVQPIDEPQLDELGLAAQISLYQYYESLAKNQRNSTTPSDDDAGPSNAITNQEFPEALNSVSENINEATPLKVFKNQEVSEVLSSVLNNIDEGAELRPIQNCEISGEDNRIPTITDKAGPSDASAEDKPRSRKNSMTDQEFETILPSKKAFLSSLNSCEE